MRTAERPSWECACQGDHHETNAGRAWCGDCSEWCYPDDPDMLCIRGLEPALRAENNRLREALETISGTGPPGWNIPKWNGETQATWAIARNALNPETQP